MSTSSNADEAGKAEFDSATADRHYSTRCFNETWTYLDKERLTPEEVDAMLHTAHASYYHWTKRDDFTPRNQSIGLWQLSRVYLAASHSYLGVHYARECIKVSEAAELDPFYLAYAYEAMARAQIEVGLTGEAERSLAYARELAAKVKDKQERKALNTDLDSVEVEIEKHT